MESEDTTAPTSRRRGKKPPLAPDRESWAGYPGAGSGRIVARQTGGSGVSSKNRSGFSLSPIFHTFRKDAPMELVPMVLNLVILSVAVFLIAQLFPAIHIKNFGTAVWVAVVYSLVNFLFGWLFLLLSLPFLIITFGLFKFVINAIMLWIADKILEDFKIDGFGWTLVAALCISVVDTVLKRILI
jgi:putative membrane protein